MPVLLLYILKLSVSLAVMFVFYQVVLRKLTFYNWNRWYLLGYSLLSFFIAFIDISPVLEQNEWSGNSLVQWVPVLQQPIGATETGTTYSISAWDIIRMILVTGMVFMFLRLVVQLLSFRRMIRKAKPLQTCTVPGTNLKLYQVDDHIIPFSFGNAIFINQSLHSQEELKEIVWHEFIHVKQKHSIDIIWGELLCLLNWYNPFAWLIRRSIRQNLEFIADNKVLENGVSRKEYQYLLLKVIGNNHFSIAPKFNFSSLKKRIAMMNKMKSAGVHIVKFLFILPLVAVLLVAFRNQHPEKQTTLPKPERLDAVLPAAIIDTVPFVTTPNSKGYLIDVIGVNGECTVVVKDKNGKEVERVILNKWKEDKSFQNKYGEILPPPPPPPSDPAVAPVAPDARVAPVDAVSPIPAVGLGLACPVSDVTAPTPSFSASGSNSRIAIAKTNGVDNLAVLCKDFEITATKAVMRMKDGSVEEYKLTNTEERRKFEKRFGRIISLPGNEAYGATPVAILDNGNGQTVLAPMNPSEAHAVMILDAKGELIDGKEDILIEITRNTTREQLENFKQQMKAKGVELTFDDIEYDGKGKLVSISGRMKSKDGQSNFSAFDFSKLILAMVKHANGSYFKVVTKDAEQS